MNTTKKLALVSLLAVGIAPGVAAAERYRDRKASSWVQLGRVGTHIHDAEDYVPVTTQQRLGQIQLVARERPVAIDRVQIQFTDGHSEFVDVNRRIMPDQAFTLTVPNSRDTVKMLVLDYGNQAPYWRARETAHLEINGLAATRDSRDHRDDRYDDSAWNAPTAPPPPRVIYTPAPPRVIYTPAPTAPVVTSTPVFVWRGGIQVRVR